MGRSQQVPLGCRVEKSSCNHSKVGIYLLCSTMAKKEEPEGHIHVVAPLCTPLSSWPHEARPGPQQDRSQSRGTGQL